MYSHIIKLYTEVDGNPRDEVDGNPHDEADGNPRDEVDGNPHDEVDGMDEETKGVDKSNGNASQDHEIQSMGDDEVDFHDERPATPPLSFDIAHTKVLTYIHMCSM